MMGTPYHDAPIQVFVYIIIGRRYLRVDGSVPVLSLYECISRVSAMCHL